MRPKGVADGHMVNIPCPLLAIKTDGGTQFRGSRGNGFQRELREGPERKIRRFVCQENPLRSEEVTVPQTDTGGRDEYSKALG